ncbi:MAG TPA: EamA family transporter [Thermoplasmata archaeon]|jgi:drug/metabolite transporter (DMT)-like permease
MPIAFAILAATLFGLSTPFAKLLVSNIPPVALAGLLYLGAFFGLGLYVVLRRIVSGKHVTSSSALKRADLPWLAGAVLSGGILAPISLMIGLTLISGFSASLLLNMEGVATTIIAAMLFKENLGRRLVVAIVCVTAAGVLLSWDPSQGTWNLLGFMLLIIAGFGWGLDNNLTRNICSRDPVQIALVKGGIAGSASLAIAIVIGSNVTMDAQIVWALALGALSYGVSLVFFVLALQGLGASRTGVFFSLGPFVGAVISILLLREWLGWVVLPAFALMTLGVLVLVYERHSHQHGHEEITHTHVHTHGDPFHDHCHSESFREPHNHEHTHKVVVHDHAHWPDIHHRHSHD